METKGEHGASLIGRNLDGDRYTLESVLGEGGMGSVYLARQRSVERQVAIKIIHPRLLMDRSLVQRFHQEAKNLAKIRSPHCVTVHDFGESEDGLLYLVMERLGGHTLEQELEASRPLSQDRLLAFVSQISAGLAAAHEIGMIHRDLKPANINIEITSSGAALLKVLDFGLSKIIFGDQAQEEANLTRTGQVFGTPRYMSPEQCQGKVLDVRTDIYSLGLIAFEALTGKPVFGGNSAVELLVAQSTLPPPDLKAIRPDLDAHLVDAIYSAIAKNPEERWSSVDDFVGALRGEISSATLVRASVPQDLEVADTLAIALAAASMPPASDFPARRVKTVGIAFLLIFFGALVAAVLIEHFPANLSFSARSCQDATPPPYNDLGEPCIDPAVIAYWSFDQDWTGRAEGQVPPFLPDAESASVTPDQRRAIGIFASGLRFDGHRDSRLVTKRPLALGDRFTVETWIKPRLTPKSFCAQFVLGTLNVGSSRACDLSRLRAGWALMIHRNAGDLFDVKFYYVGADANKKTGGRPEKHVLVGSTPIVADEWSQIAISADGQQVHIIVNGRQQTYERPARILSQGSARMQFGGYPFRIDGNFAGEIDSVRISSTPRSTDQITQAYKRGKRLAPLPH
jgi:hypothetical protein